MLAISGFFVNKDFLDRVVRGVCGTVRLKLEVRGDDVMRGSGEFKNAIRRQDRVKKSNLSNLKQAS